MDVLWAAGAFIMLCFLLIGPALEDLLRQNAGKSGKGELGVEGLRAGLMLIHGLPHDLPMALWGALAATGVGLVFRRYPYECLCMVAVTVTQIAFIWVRQPMMAEQTFVWFRYTAHLLPFFIIIATAPFAWILTALAGKVRFRPLPVVAAGAIVGLLFTAHLQGDRYALGRAHASNMHPWFMYLEADGPNGVRPPSPFYSSPLLSDGSGGEGSPRALIEAPFVAVFPLYAQYQRTTGWPIYAGLVGRGSFRAFSSHPGLRLETTVDLEELDPATVPDARFLVWHKQIQAELRSAMAQVMDSWPARLHAPLPRRLSTFAALDYGPEPVRLPDRIRMGFDVVYDDDFITVFDLDSPIRPGDSSRQEISRPRFS